MHQKLKIILFFSFFSFSYSQDCCEAANIANDNCDGLGCYIPQCTENCEWEPTQCWGSTGYCWCVDENGTEIEGTSIPSWQGYPNCNSENIIGDFNDDETLDVLDIIILVNHILSPAAVELDGADINEDGNINVLDIIQLIDIILN